MPSHEYEQAKNMALLLLKQYKPPTKENIETAVETAIGAFEQMGATSETVEADALIREIQTLVNIYCPDGTALFDPKGHIPWLPDTRSKINWDFWRRYEVYLEQHKSLPPSVIDRLAGLTDRILENLEDPRRSGKWDRRGMVVGQVQSGKTANYTGLICKAVDAGYKLIIVLAGTQNSLRSQTQLRLDEGFLGRDSVQSRVFQQGSALIGVGHIVLTTRQLPAQSLTTSADDGDFKKAKATSLATYLGSDPVILVIKKFGSILNNLINWVQTTNVGEKDADGRYHVKNLPLLLLDDEADYASVNTKRLELDVDGNFKDVQSVTSINGLIRQMLDMFDQVAYVGYTATPFANIFIPPDAATIQHGEDLFPRSFIINLPAPSNYIGPAQLFGLDSSSELQPQALPIIRIIDDSDPIIPPSHKPTLQVPELPDSLKSAIRSFILTCAARRARHQEQSHNSMLIHVTRFNDVQTQVADLVTSELRVLKRRLEYGDGNRSVKLIDELRIMWEQDYIPTMALMKDCLHDPNSITISWTDVEQNLKDAALKIDVKTINGKAGDVLDYYDHPTGISVIAIGGDKLSRGLTLEGLSVSYYLRSSRMYDTLMQMGRWFGYRPGYADLCRLYTTQELNDWYEHITIASEALRVEFDRMHSARLTPIDYGLKVQTHPGGLTITNAGKMRYGKRLRVSFDNSLIETYLLLKSADTIGHNFKETESLVSTLGAPTRKKGSDVVWEDVPGDTVVRYLDRTRGHRDLPTFDPRNPNKVGEYINKKINRGELISWTVALMSVRSKVEERAAIIAGIQVGMSGRTPNQQKSDEDTIAIKNRHIITEGDEYIDLTPEEYQEALAGTQNLSREKAGPSADVPKKPGGAFIRAARDCRRGLLLLYPLDPAYVFEEGDGRRSGPPIIGFAISFPGSNYNDAVEYIVNSVYWDEEFAYLKEPHESSEDD